MNIPEQIRRIVKAAPNLPIQMTITIGLLIGTGIVCYKALDGLFANWKKGSAELIEFSDVQERTRDGEPDYFYKLHYEFVVNNQEYQVKRERSFRTPNQALQTLDEEVKIDFLPVWYSSWNPNNATLNESKTKWYYFLYALIPVFLALTYLRWLFLKYYELEIEE